MREMKLSHAGASSALTRWQKTGLVRQVRRNMYAVIDLASDAPLADKYEIASRVSETSYVGWHTALEFHGLAHQPFYNAFVGSNTRFNDFNFELTDYEYCASPFEPTEESGVMRPKGNPYVKITDIERTIVDCCDRIERAGGIEELLHCLECVTLLDEDKIARYLGMYGKTFLYQKVGFILERTQEYHRVSDGLIEECRTKGALHTKRMTNTRESDTYVREWKLYVPNYCVNAGMPDEYAII